MKLNDKAEIYLPRGKEIAIDELCVAAHQDDIEFMAFGGIYNCIQNNKVFGGVVVTDGSGSPRAGKFAGCTDAQMMSLRRAEQIKASEIGKYGVQVLLNHPSREVKGPSADAVTNDIEQLLINYKPKVVYTHNLADKHDTHVGVAVKLINAIRRLDKKDRPQKVYGCEVWRGLDWMCDDDKTVADVSGGRELAMELMRVFESQIEGGKRYDLATDGRRFANATYFASHATDTASQVCYHMDLTPLITNDKADIGSFINGFFERFKTEVFSRLNKLTIK